jgi:hypothetical protein
MFPFTFLSQADHPIRCFLSKALQVLPEKPPLRAHRKVQPASSA